MAEAIRAVTVVLVGVATPSTFTYRGVTYSFASLQGVNGDLDWYEQFVRGAVPDERLRLYRWDDQKVTTSAAIRDGLGQVASALPEGGLLVVVLCGHGFQATDDNGDEPDALDEVFAASDGPVLDDHFGQAWDSMKASTDLVVIVDSCSADTLGIRGGRDVEPVLSYRTSGPARLSISASMAWEKAGEVTTRHGARGQLSLALEDAWLDPDARSSYLAWFRAAADLLAVRRPQQHPRLRFLGPDDRLMMRPPLT